MPRVKGGVHTRARHKKVMKAARGHRAGRSRVYKRARTSVMKAMVYAYVHRRNKKREYRSLWIARINAAARALGVKYSQLIAWMTKAEIGLDRRALADLAIHHPDDFAAVVSHARQAAGA
jgi:large subunit ribosomal protein L20